MKECFIIMPITTPEFMLEHYRDQEEHFEHVLASLFIPAIEKAEFKPIPPIMTGSNIIQADIIDLLIKTDLVLCDISCLNPNVFFELGIRTAMNRPVCHVKDENTKKIPFDNAMINHHEYKSSLNAWDKEVEIEKLSNHIKKSMEKSGDINKMWERFGLTAMASPPQRDGSTDSQFRLLIDEINVVKHKIDELNAPTEDGLLRRDKVLRKNVLHKLTDIAQTHGAEVISYSPSDPLKIRIVKDSLGYIGVLKLKTYAKDKGYNLEIIEM